MSQVRYVDADGHVVEHPTAIAEHAPRAWRDRVWHVETDRDGQEWVVFDGHREPANVYTASAAAGFSDEQKAAAFRGELRYSELPRGAFEAGPRLAALDDDGIDLSVLYPTGMLAIYDVADCRSSRAFGPWMAFAKRHIWVSTWACFAARYSFFLFRVVRFLIFSRSESTAYFRPK